MHYRNGREAKNGDPIVAIGNDGKIVSVGVLHGANATSGSYCNGAIAPTQQFNGTACLCDCLHAEDVAALIKEKGLDKRPEGM